MVPTRHRAPCPPLSTWRAQYKRIAEEPRFRDPAGLDREHIAKFLEPRQFGGKWERVQWWWIRDGTQNRTLAEAVALMRDKFSVGLSSRIDETLLIWKRKLQLDTRDVIYASMKSSLSHPRIADWHPDEVAAARALVTTSGDDVYYEAAAQLFERQVAEYGADQLGRDLRALRALLTRLNELCAAVTVDSETLHVPDKVYWCDAAPCSLAEPTLNPSAACCGDTTSRTSASRPRPSRWAASQGSPQRGAAGSRRSCWTKT